jgi:hypothetical protein
MRYFRCTAHTLDLMVDAMYKDLEIQGLLSGLNWYTRLMYKSLQSAGLSPARLKTMTMKFHYAHQTLVHLKTQWVALLAFIAANVPSIVADATKKLARRAAAVADAAKSRLSGRKRKAAAISKDDDDVVSSDSDGDEARDVEAGGAGAGAGAVGGDDAAAIAAAKHRKYEGLKAQFEELKSTMGTPLARARFTIARELTGPLVELIAASESASGTLPPNYATNIEGAMAMLKTFHESPEMLIDIAEHELGKPLSADDRASLKLDIECAIEGAWLKGKAALDEDLPFLKTIEALDSRSSPLLATDAVILGPKKGRAISAAVVTGLHIYRAKYSTWTDTDRSDPVAFWRARLKDSNPNLQAFAQHALWYLSVPLSTAAVERSFSIMRSMAVKTKTTMTPASVQTEMSLRVNRSYVIELLREKVKAVLPPKKAKAAVAGAGGADGGAGAGAGAGAV